MSFGRLFKFIGMLIVGLPMALIMGVSDAPLKDGETHASRWKSIKKSILSKDGLKFLMMAWKQFNEAENANAKR